MSMRPRYNELLVLLKVGGHIDAGMVSNWFDHEDAYGPVQSMSIERDMASTRVNFGSGESLALVGVTADKTALRTVDELLEDLLKDWPTLSNEEKQGAVYAARYELGKLLPKEPVAPFAGMDSRWHGGCPKCAYSWEAEISAGEGEIVTKTYTCTECGYSEVAKSNGA